MTQTPQLEIKNLSVEFSQETKKILAVKNISYSVYPGETLGIVGESGSGKSVTHLSYLEILPSPPLRITNGDVLFKNISLLQNGGFKKIRGNRITMIFQDPMTSLNPYLTIGTQVAEPLLIHQKLSKSEALKKAQEALDRVGISESGKALKSYPHEFSGGMRQRVMIAMALITKPDVLIADEPTTALDVTVQNQILVLIQEIQKENGMSVVFISHDLGVIAQMATRVVVMQAGNIVETGSSEDIFYRPQNPYTQKLLHSIPQLHKKVTTL